jgi:hypothetical protein
MSKPAYTVATFCGDHHISKAFLYKLIGEGRGPRLMKIGRRTLISSEAAADWRAQMETQTDQKATSFWDKEAA